MNGETNCPMNRALNMTCPRLHERIPSITSGKRFAVKNVTGRRPWQSELPPVPTVPGAGFEPARSVSFRGVQDLRWRVAGLPVE